MAAGDTGSFSVVSVDEQRIAELEAKSLVDAQRIAELEAKSLADAQRITEFEFAIKAWEKWKDGKSEAPEAWRHWAHQRLYFGCTPIPPDPDDVLMQKLTDLWNREVDSAERSSFGRLREWRDWVVRLGCPSLGTDDELMRWVVGKWQRLEESVAESSACQNTLRRERDEEREARNTWFEKRTAGEKEALASAGRYQANSLEEWRRWAKKYVGQEGGGLFDTELRAAIEHRFLANLASVAEIEHEKRLEEWRVWAHKFTVRLGTQASRVQGSTLDTELRAVIDEWSNRACEKHTDALSRIAELEKLPTTSVKGYVPLPGSELQEALFAAWTQRDKAQNELIANQAELESCGEAITGLVNEASALSSLLQEWREWASLVGGNGAFAGEADSWLRVRVGDKALRGDTWKVWAQEQAGGKLEVGETDSELQARVAAVLKKGSALKVILQENVVGPLSNAEIFAIRHDLLKRGLIP